MQVNRNNPMARTLRTEFADARGELNCLISDGSDGRFPLTHTRGVKLTHKSEWRGCVRSVREME